MTAPRPHTDVSQHSGGLHPDSFGRPVVGQIASRARRIWRKKRERMQAEQRTRGNVTMSFSSSRAGHKRLVKFNGRAHKYAQPRQRTAKSPVDGHPLTVLGLSTLTVPRGALKNAASGAKNFVRTKVEVFEVGGTVGKGSAIPRKVRPHSDSTFISDGSTAPADVISVSHSARTFVAVVADNGEVLEAEFRFADVELSSRAAIQPGAKMLVQFGTISSIVSFKLKLDPTHNERVTDFDPEALRGLFRGWPAAS